MNYIYPKMRVCEARNQQGKGKRLISTENRTT